MAKKSSSSEESSNKLSTAEKLLADVQMVAKTRRIRWVDFNEPPDSMGHGVEFIYVHRRRGDLVAFMDDFGWMHKYGARSPTVRLRRTCPTSIDPDRWPEIIKAAREAVYLILATDDNLSCRFKHGPIEIGING